MAPRKDKEKVVDEVWTQERVKDFLHVKPAEDVAPDFHMLLKAYQSMRVENFEDFVGYFVEAGHDINARNPRGESVLDVVSQHRRSTEYADILRDNGAS